LDACLDVHCHSDVSTDPDPSTHLHPNKHADTSAGNECHLHGDAIPNLDTDTHPDAYRNPHRHPNRLSHAHSHRDRLAHADDHTLTDSHSYADPDADPYMDADAYPDPYMDTDAYPNTNAKLYLHRHANCIHHTDHHSATTLIPCMAISNKRIL
jgi:hypothetical protein